MRIAQQDQQLPASRMAVLPGLVRMRVETRRRVARLGCVS
jgi:hypothetical protein